MKENEMRLHRLVLPALTLMLLAMCLTAMAQSDAEVAASFKKYAREYVESYKADRHEQFVQTWKLDKRGAPELDAHGNPVIGGDWYKEYFEVSPDYAIDVHKTDSLISPYLGVLEFSITQHRTALHYSKEEAANDSTYPALSSDDLRLQTAKHKHTYAFQDGAWVPQSRQNNPGFAFPKDKWLDCRPMDENWEAK